MGEEVKSPTCYVGREVLFTSEKVITKDNLLKVLDRVLPIYEKNKNESDYLYWYYRGKQPILNRIKKFRPEINNKVVENHANEIVSFKKGYTFGEPVQYVRRAVKDQGTVNPTGDNGEAIMRLNEIMACEDKASSDEELAEWFFITGTAYRMALPKEEDDDTVSKIEMETLDSRYTAIVYNTGFGKKPVMSIQEVVIDSEEDIRRFCIYTPHEYFEVEDGKIVKQEPHILGTIPIIEYPANNTRIGAFELVLQLLDAINLATSNRLDGIEQFIQSFMKFINVRIDKEKYEQLKEEGALLFTSEPGNPADVGIVSSELNQSQTQIVVDHLYQMVLIICGMPDRQGNNRTTGDTGQAVMLRDGWAAAESKAKETESSFKKSEKKFLKYILSLEDDLQLKVSDIDIKFTRNKTDNLLTKTQGLQNMLEAGVTPQIAFSLSNLFSDPEQACKDSEPYLQKWVPKKETEKAPEGNDPNGTPTPANNKPNPKEE